MIRYLIVLMFCLLFSTSPHAQNLKLDSLKRKLKDLSLNDTSKVWVLLEIAKQVFSPRGRNSNNAHKLDSAILVINQALVLSKRINFMKGIGWSYHTLGMAYNSKQLRNQALDYFLKGLQIGEKSSDQLMTASFHNEIGNVYSSLHLELNSDRMFQKALYHYRQSLKLALASNSKDARSLVAIPTANIGQLFSANKNYDSAIFYYRRSIELEISENDRDKVGIRGQFDLIGVYEEQGDWKRALQIAKQVLGSASMGKSTNTEGERFEDIYSELAFIHLELKNYDSAHYFISKSIRLRETGKDIQMLLSGYNILTDYYLKRGDYNKAILTAQKVINGAKGHSWPIHGYYKIISDSYAKLGNYKKALDYHRLFSTLADSLTKENMAAKVLGQQADFDAAKQIDAIDLLEKEAEINSLAIQRDRIIQYLIGGMLLLALVIIGIVVNQYRLIRRSKKEQERMFKEVDTLKSRFFANISHEFRTPLTLILGPLEKKLSAVTEPSDRTELTLMHRNASRLLVLVNQLLDLSRLEAGQLKLNCQFADLHLAIQSIASQFSSMADSKGVQKKHLMFEHKVVCPARISRREWQNRANITWRQEIMDSLEGRARFLTDDGSPNHCARRIALVLQWTAKTSQYGCLTNAQFRNRRIDFRIFARDYQYLRWKVWAPFDRRQQSSNHREIETRRKGRNVNDDVSDTVDEAVGR